MCAVWGMGLMETRGHLEIDGEVVTHIQGTAGQVLVAKMRRGGIPHIR